ncbi:hypothetical protein WICPIJ_000289 [Wickerhamomyces pijperi]|uniref:Uncharacterized protein n=1 Tax=Wickerhamomyces pijperi TaxID=599730 RepID=A0A9P8QH61_WICPI|nr:hypothetical protein WICPIJ_000289 [Wickerhamomyces pijperi]
MNSAYIESMIKPMSADQIIATLTKLQASGINMTAFDMPAILSVLNITQVQGLLASNSTVVNGLLQSLKPAQLYTIVGNFQNLTSTALITGAKTQDAALIQTTESVIALLMKKINSVFLDSQLYGLFSLMSNGAAPGTGSKKMLALATKLINGFLGGVVPASSVSVPERITKMIAYSQQSIFGDYPTTKDVAPSAIFTAIFFLFAIAHAGIWIKNRSLGHKFNISLGLCFYSLVRALGFLLRIVWAKHTFELNVALVSTIFIVIPTSFLPSLNLILAQRYFTWKHPSYGSHKLFQTVMYIIYFLVFAFILMTIVAAAVQTNYFLSAKHYLMTKQVIEASATLVVLYSAAATALVLFAEFVPKTSQDEHIKTFQPKWIKSFSYNYWVPKNAATEAANAVPEELRDATRIINSTNYHYTTINEEQEEVTEKSSVLSHNSSIFIVAFTTLALFIADVFRCVSTYIHQTKAAQSWIFEPVVMYVMFGVLETLINLVYIFGRIDLRFYKPDSFKASATVAAPVSQDSEVASSEASQEVKEAASA